MEMDQIIKLIQEVSNSSLLSFKYVKDNLTIELSKNKDINQETYQSSEEVKKVNTSKEEDPTGVENNDKFTIKSPIVGTFYASSSEDGDPYIQVGDRIKKGQIIAIVEAMKIMNEIESTVDGVVEEILVENQEVVEYGQSLVLIQA